MDASAPLLPDDLLLRHRPFARALARAILQDEHLAEDVAQESWLRWRARPPQEARALRTWLAEVARRLSIDQLRERRRRRLREERGAQHEALPDAAAELARAEVLRSVVEAVLELEEPYKSTVLCAYWRGWDAERIARATNTPVATVRSRLQRAHAQIRGRLERTHRREYWLPAIGAMAFDKPWGPLSWLGGAGLPWASLAAMLVALATIGWYSKREGNNPIPLHSASRPAEEAWSRAPLLDNPDENARRQSSGEEAALDDQLVLEGRVLQRGYPALGFEDGPAANAQVQLWLSRNKSGSDRIAQPLLITTDAAGQFQHSFAGPFDFPLYAIAVLEGDGRYRDLYEALPIQTAQTQLELLRVAHGILAGYVRDDAGQVLADVLLNVRGPAGKTTALSQADGSFAMEFQGPVRELQAELAGHELLPWVAPSMLAEGGFAPWELTLSSRAQLQLELQDAHGRGIAGAAVSVQLHESELAVLSPARPDAQRAAHAITDEQGRVLLDHLWANHRLLVCIRHELQSYEADSVRAGQLVLDLRERPGAEFLSLNRGAGNRLLARLGREQVLEGLVRRHDGSLAVDAKIEVRDLGAITPGQAEVALARTQSDAAGRFRLHWHCAYLQGPLLLQAELPESAAPQSASELGYIGEPADKRAAEAGQLRLAIGASQTYEQIELRLDPTLQIAGALCAANGASLAQTQRRCRVWLLPEGQSFAHRSLRPQPLNDQGEFAFKGLLPGNYDLYIAEDHGTFYTYENFLHRFPGFAAGTTGIALRLPEPKTVQVRLRLAQGMQGQCMVLHRKFFAFNEREQRPTSAAQRMLVESRHGWPEGSHLSFAGISGWRNELGVFSDGYDGATLDGATWHTIAALEPGWYQFGLHVLASSESLAFAPQATELLYFEGGEYWIEFQPVQRGNLRGRYVGRESRGILAVQLVDESGTPVRFAVNQGRAGLTALAELNAKQAFALEHVPCGSFRLRLGSPLDLERGHWIMEHPVEIRPGENGPLVLGD